MKTQERNDMEELKPCPFCGGEAEYDNSDYRGGGQWIGCKTCGGRAWKPYRTGDEVYVLWNARPIEDSLRKERDELREACGEAYIYLASCLVHMEDPESHKNLKNMAMKMRDLSEETPTGKE